MMQRDLYYHWQMSRANAGLSVSFFARMRRHPSLALEMRHEFYDEGTDTGPHQHQDFYALYVVQGGRGVHVINEHPYGIARGDVYLLPPGTTHGYRDYCTLAIDGFYFQPQLFSQEELTALRGLAGFWRLLITLEISNDGEMQHHDKLDHRLHLPPERQRELEGMISEICEEFTGETVEAGLLTQSQFFRMLVHLARWQAAERKTAGMDEAVDGGRTGSLYKAEITNVLRICEERFHEPLTVPQLAAFTFLSPSRFSELFSREVGMSPAAYIRKLRLERAQTLLRTTALSTTAIAHQVGFRDSAQLSRVFRDVFQLTPTAYRATFR